MMKRLIVLVLAVLMSQAVYSQGWGQGGWNEGGWGVGYIAPVSQPASGGGGGGGSVYIPANLTYPFGYVPNPLFINRSLYNSNYTDEGCLVGEQLFDGRCFPCDIKKGYLQFNTQDRSVICITCSEGFTKIGNICLPNPTPFDPNNYGNTSKKLLIASVAVIVLIKFLQVRPRKKEETNNQNIDDENQ